MEGGKITFKMLVKFYSNSGDLFFSIFLGITIYWQSEQELCQSTVSLSSDCGVAVPF